MTGVSRLLWSPEVSAVWICSGFGCHVRDTCEGYTLVFCLRIMGGVLEITAGILVIFVLALAAEIFFACSRLVKWISKRVLLFLSQHVYVAKPHSEAHAISQSAHTHFALDNPVN